MAPAEFWLARQQVIKVPAPAGRVFALAKSLGLRGIQDLFDPAAQ